MNECKQCDIRFNIGIVLGLLLGVLFGFCAGHIMSQRRAMADIREIERMHGEMVRIAKEGEELQKQRGDRIKQMLEDLMGRK